MVLVITGCASQPEVKKTEPIDPTSGTVTFIIPAADQSVVAPSPQDIARRVLFNNQSHAYREEPLEVLNWQVTQTGFTVEKYKRPIDRDWRWATIKYDGSIRMSSTGKDYHLTFLPEQCFTYVNQYAPRPWLVQFSPADFVENLTEAAFPWQIEVNSEFNTDSTYANFARFARKEFFQEGGWRDPVTGKIFKERFWIRLGNREIPVNVETFPYRNGSKVIVYARLKGIVSGKTVDFSKAAEMLKHEVERIVKD